MAPPRPARSLSAGPARTHHVFVDFENVPTVDLSRIEHQPAQVTLLIGEKQRRLDLGLVRQIHTHAAQVTLVEVGASGRNALDLVLAWHLGKTVERHPEDAFFVVSKDKDYDPLIRHLRAAHLEVSRVDAFTALPFLTETSRASRRRTPASSASPRTQRTPAPAAADPHPDTDADPAPSPHVSPERFDRLIDRLQHRTKARPVRHKTLVSHVASFFGGQLSNEDAEGIVAQLESRGVIRPLPNGRIEYPPE